MYNREEMHKYTIDIPLNLWDVLKEEAEKEGMRLADFIRKIFKIFCGVNNE